MAGADVFVDSAGFLALWDAGDEHHGRAVQIQQDCANRSRRFESTEDIVDEKVTLLLVRHSHAADVDFFETIDRKSTCPNFSYTELSYAVFFSINTK